MKKRNDGWMLYLVLGFAVVFVMACAAVSGAPGGEGAPAADEGSAGEPEEGEEPPEAEPSEGGDALDDPAGAVVDSAYRLKELKSYRTKTWQESRGEETAVVKEYLNPDRYRSVGPDGTEIIIIGDEMYTRAGDSWTVDTQEGLADAYMKVYVTEDTVQDAQLEGEEDLDGASCWKIRYTATLTDGSTYEAVVWVGVQDGLPHKSTTQPTPDMTNVILYYDFDADITIEPPPDVE